MTAMPYSKALHYLEAGWSPIPLPYKEKSPVPDDVTGSTAPYVDDAQIKRWVKGGRAKAGNLNFLPGNIALRLPPNVIGIDIDLYDGKAGAETLAEAEAKWGELPDTWQSTSRTDGSGIRYYRVPEGLKWRDVGAGIETIKWYHRYAIVWPSIHDKTGQRYYWIKPDGSSSGVVSGPGVQVEFPSVDELPELPQKWVEGLTGGESYTGSGDAGDINYESAKEWLEVHGDGDLCATMHDTLLKYTRSVREAGEDGGAHDAARDGAWALLGDAGLGHTGASEALSQLRATFLEAVKGRRDGTAEWRRAVIKGVGKVKNELKRTGEPDGDPCDMFADTAKPATAKGAGGTKGKSRSVGSDTFDYKCDDIGNAQRLQRATRGEAKWVDAWSTWVTYNEQSSLWDRLGGNASMTRSALAVVRKMGEEAAFIEGADDLKAFKSWIKTSGSNQRLKAMIELARVLGGMWANAEEFDADWTHLNCANGLVVLGDETLFRMRRLEDMATLASPVAYDPGAKSALWLRFLEDVLPNPDTRLWVQKLVGMSLVGGNPERSMVIGIGPTTSGKSTFVEVLATALGGYAATYNLQMMREKRDEGPRVDLLAALPKRFLYCVEASSDVQLHVDSIKRMTGGDRLTARGMASNRYVEAVPAFTPWLMCNEVPNVPGADAALKRRLKVAPFGVSLSPEQVDPTLKPRLCGPDELPGILAWAVEGWSLYKADGLPEGGPNLEVMEATFDVRDSLSVLDAWLRSACEFGPECFQRTEELHEAYRTWLDLHNEEDRRHASLSGFGRALSNNNFPKTRMYVDGVQTTVRLGLKLKKVKTKA